MHILEIQVATQKIIAALQPNSFTFQSCKGFREEEEIDFGLAPDCNASQKHLYHTKTQHCNTKDEAFHENPAAGFSALRFF